MLSSELNRLTANRVYFDPQNPDHRQIVAKYMVTRSWKHTDTRFFIEQPYSNVVSLVTAKLAEYYAEKEFPGIVVLNTSVGE